MIESVHGKTLRKVVIFGAGYVGGEVARRALAAGHPVIALTRNLQAAAYLRTNGVEVIQARLESDEWHSQVDGTDAWVLNAVSSGGGGVEGYRSSYLQGMRSILAWASRGGGLDALVYTSSTSVYPQGEGVVIDESASAQPEDEAGQVLRAAEDQLMSAAPEAVRRWCILRLAGIYGPSRHHILDQLRAGATELGGRGDFHLNLIHRDDIAAAVELAWQRAHNQVFNLADDTPTLKADMVAWLAQRLGIPVPTFTGVPTAGRRRTVPDRIIANGKIKAHLQWKPRYADFRAGYRELLET